MTNTLPCWITPLPDIEQQVTTSNNQKEVSRYLRKTKEDQKKYHDRHASENMHERTWDWNQSSNAALDRLQRVEASHCSQTSPYAKILCSASWGWRKVSLHLRVCPALGLGSLDAGLSLASRVQQAVTQDKESPTDKPEQAAGPQRCQTVFHSKSNNLNGQKRIVQTSMSPEVADE